MKKLVKILSLVIIQCIIYVHCFSQEYQNETFVPIDHSNTVWCQEMLSSSPNVFVAQAAYQAYFEEHGNEESKWRNIFRRWIEDARLSIDEEGNHIPRPYHPKAFLKAKKHQAKENGGAALNTGTWKLLGPNFGERTQCGTSSNLSGGFCDRVYINPYNTSNLFAGFSYGGLWVSQDQGDTWELTDSHIPNGTNTYANRDLYYGEIEASAVDGNLVYAATEYALLKSNDAGLSWSICPELNREDAGDIRSYYIALSPVDSAVVLATFGRQLFRSSDSGNTWTVVFDNSNGGANHQFTNQYSNNSTFGIYERTYNFFGLERAENNPEVYYLGVWNAQNEPEIYTSTDGGLSFQALVDLNSDLGRTLPNNLVLQTLEGQPNKFYVHSLFTYDSLYQFQNDGQLLNRSLINTSVVSFGTDVNSLEAFAINPANDNEMYGGFYFASAITKSVNGGLSFVDQTSGYSGCPKYVHPDVRSIDVQGDLVLIGSDGGLAISKDGMATVSSDIGREICAIDLWGFSSSTRTDLIAVGCDHGPTKIRRFDGENGWLSVGGGDASDVSINSSNEEWVFFDRAIDYQFKAQLDANNNFISDVSINDDIDLNQIPFHPFLHPRAYVVQDNELRKTDNNFLLFTTVNTFNTNIRVVRIAPDNPDVLYVLLENGSIQKTIDGGINWTGVTPTASESSAQSNLLDIVVGKDENELWAAYGNWQNTAKILRSTDGGDTYENITTDNLPLTPVSQIAYQAGTEGGIYLAFAGSSGVWYRNNDMPQWEELGSGLPTFGYIRNIFTVPNKGKLRIGTSRGVWEHDLYETSSPVANFAIQSNSWFCGFPIDFIQNSTHAPGNVSYEWIFEGGTPEFSADAEPSVEYAQAGTYDVSLTVTDDQGQSETQLLSDFITINEGSNCTTTAIEKLPFENIKVHPIPTQKQLFVELTDMEQEVEVQVLSTNGQVVLQQSFTNRSAFSIDLSALAAGVYFLEIKGAERLSQIKIVKE